MWLRLKPRTSASLFPPPYLVYSTYGPVIINRFDLFWEQRWPVCGDRWLEGVGSFFQTVALFPFCRQARTIWVIGSNSRNAMHVWTTCINGAALHTPVLWNCGETLRFSPMSQMLRVISGNVDGFRGLQGVTRLFGSDSMGKKQNFFVLPAALDTHPNTKLFMTDCT